MRCQAVIVLDLVDKIIIGNKQFALLILLIILQ